MSTYLSCSCHHFLYFHIALVTSLLFPLFVTLRLSTLLSAPPPSYFLSILHLCIPPPLFYSCVPFEWAEWAENTQESWVHFFPLGCPLARKSPMGTCDIPAIGCCCRLVLPLLILWGLRWLERKPN
ncbi:hypothetical protein F5H01DRAFT_345202 [Linnemannia elongata]|nr:hypothetical protein F5H01DRAFT_345202 [Linnemannia elongata]